VEDDNFTAMIYVLNLILWLGATAIGLILLWWMEPKKGKATVLTLITLLPALLGGPIFLLMVVGKAVFAPLQNDCHNCGAVRYHH
jgi:hypothetical protein